MTRILVIDDTQEILDLFHEILTDEGFDVVLSAYVFQEMADVERVNPDLIILDTMFGEEKLGWQMLQKLKMRASTASIPVILCSAALLSAQELEGHLMTKGVSVVIKPFDIDELIEAVKAALHHRT